MGEECERGVGEVWGRCRRGAGRAASRLTGVPLRGERLLDLGRPEDATHRDQAGARPLEHPLGALGRAVVGDAVDDHLAHL